MKNIIKTVSSILGILFCMSPKIDRLVKAENESESKIVAWNNFVDSVEEHPLTVTAVAASIAFLSGRVCNASAKVNLPNYIVENSPKSPIPPVPCTIDENNQKENLKKIKTFGDLKQIAEESWIKNGWNIKEANAVVKLEKSEAECRKSYFQPYGLLGPIYALDAYDVQSMSDGDKAQLYKGGLPPDDTPVYDITDYVWESLLATLEQFHKDLQKVTSTWNVPNTDKDKMSLGDTFSLIVKMIGRKNSSGENLTWFDVILKLFFNNGGKLDKDGISKYLFWIRYANILINFLFPKALLNENHPLYNIFVKPEKGKMMKALNYAGFGTPFYLYNGDCAPIVGVQLKDKCRDFDALRKNNYIQFNNKSEEHMVVLMHANSCSSPCVSDNIQKNQTTNPSIVLGSDFSEVIGYKEGTLFQNLKFNLSPKNVLIRKTVDMLCKWKEAKNLVELVYNFLEHYGAESYLKIVYMFCSLLSDLDKLNSSQLPNLSSKLDSLNEELKKKNLSPIPFKNYISAYNYDKSFAWLRKLTKLLKNNLSDDEIENLADYLSTQTPHENVK